MIGSLELTGRPATLAGLPVLKPGFPDARVATAIPQPDQQ